MKKFSYLKALSYITTLGCALALSVGTAQAADHIDSPAAMSEPAADITDLYAWMSDDAQHLNLVLNVHPFAGEKSAFSDAVQYVFHVNSSPGYGEESTETQIICSFYSENKVECWAGDEYVEGNARKAAGVASQSGKVRVFADLRNDPFFMEFSGFLNTVNTVTSVAGDLNFDEQGCPTVDADTSAVLVGMLQSGNEGAPASDFFQDINVLSLVIQIDKSVINAGGPILGIWASTHATN